MHTSLNWELASGRRLIVSGEIADVLSTIQAVAEIERRSAFLESQMARVEDMASSVLQLQALNTRAARLAKRSEASGGDDA